MKMSENINELATALVVAQGLIQNPTKSVSNAFFKSKYADLAGVIDVCRPAFTEAGIAVIQARQPLMTAALLLLPHWCIPADSGCQSRSQWQLTRAPRTRLRLLGH
jgi:hypothetical protein